jgi:iron complex transport system substrate-binding protein
VRVLLIIIAGIALLTGCGKPAPVRPRGGEVRVVSLAPSLTEMICRLGAGETLVGRSRVCAFPATVTNVAVAGDFGAPVLETLAKLAPDWVLTVDSEDRNTGRAIERLGIQHREIPCRSLDDIPRALRTLGQILQKETEANALAGDLEREIAGLRRAPRSANPPKVFIEVWGDPLMTAGKQAFISELVELAGGTNVMADVERDFFQVTPEAILTRNPDVIVMLEADSAAQASVAVARRPGWAQLNAVKNGRVCSGLDRNVLEVPGPRVLQGVDLLRGCLR